MANFNNRLKFLRTSNELSQQALANKIGVSKSSINMYERGEREPGFETLERIADFFNVDIDYLLGKSDHQNKASWLLSGAYELPDDKNLYKEILSKIPLYDLPVSAGTGQWLADGYEYAFALLEDVPKDTDFALRVRGNSMEPMYFDDDIVFVKTNVIVESGQVGVFFLNGDGYLKMLQGNRLSSLNKDYDPIVVEDFDTFFCIGRVVGKTHI